MVFLLQLAMFVASTTRLLGFPQSLHHISEKKPSLHYSPGETSLIPISLVPARLTQQLLSLQQAGLALLARTAEVDLHRSETATVAIEGTMQ
jgi:hypothetical protein